jgi:hypothetical protein
MNETMFENMNEAFAQTLSENPSAVYNKKFVKTVSEPAAAAIQSDLCNRTPINQPLPPQIVAALNLTLLAEYLETEFYSIGLNTPGLIPNDLRQVFVRILLNEVCHREILLTVLGANAIPKPAFDFTARGVTSNVFQDFQTYTNLGRAFEDNGVRAVKGQAGNVQPDDFVLTTALRFHSVEARHASELRRIVGLKGWITLNQRGNLPLLAQGIYDGEENVVQAGINLVALTGYSAATVSEAFDEPLTAAQVMANINPFIRRQVNGELQVVPLGQ